MFLGIDNGLTVTKAVIFDGQGHKVAVSKAKNCFRGNRIDMAALWETTAGCIRDVLRKSGVPGSAIRAIGNSGHGNGLYFIDKNGRPCDLAFGSMSEVAEGEISRLTLERREELSEMTTQKLWPGQPLPILLYLKRNEPALFSNIHKILFCKDWIRYKLTGNVCTDYTDASGGGLLNNISKQYDEKILSLLDLEEAVPLLPELKKSYEPAGVISKSAAAETGLAEGTVVSAGMFDVNACMIGSGITDEKNYSIISGTWGINSALTNECRVDRQVLQCCLFADCDHYVGIESAPTSAVNLEWFLTNVMGGYSYERADKIVAEVYPKLSDVIYLPYIYSGIHTRGMQAGFYGLRAEHTATDLIAAVYYGVAMGHRAQLARLENAGFRASGCVLSGGAAHSDVWVQIFADVLAKPITVCREKETGALGAAISAAIAVGEYDNFSGAVRRMTEQCKTFIPAKTNGDRVEEQYEKFKKLNGLIGEGNNEF